MIGGYISTDNNLTGTINSNDPSYENDRIDITQNLVSTIAGNKSLSKIGIQAPPGTKIQFDESENKIIMVGATGIYELDNILINYLSFIKPNKFEKDESATNTALEEGQQEIQEAEETKNAALDSLNSQDPIPPDYLEQYTKIYDTFTEKCEAAVIKLNQGINGIYKIVDGEQEDLYNIILDYIYDDNVGGEI